MERGGGEEGQRGRSEKKRSFKCSKSWHIIKHYKQENKAAIQQEHRVSIILVPLAGRGPLATGVSRAETHKEGDIYFGNLCPEAEL